MQKESKKILNFHSSFWSWPILAGIFFGIGYSITKNIFLSNISTEEEVNHLKVSQEFQGPNKPVSKGTHKLSIITSKNESKKGK